MRQRIRKKIQKPSKINLPKLFLLIPLLGFITFAAWLPYQKNKNQKIENEKEYKALIQNQENHEEKLKIAKDNEEKILGSTTSQVRVPILLYHYIGENPNSDDKARDYLSVTPQKFDEQMAYLSQNGYQTISLDTLAAALLNGQSLPEKPVILTFDDGYIDFYLNAFPILSKYNFSATVFIPSGKIGQNMFLSWGQIEELARSGRFIFNSHGVSHTGLSSLNGASLEEEVTKSKQEIESHTGYPVNFLAYPYGSYSGAVISASQRAGYVGGVTTRIGSLATKDNLFTLPRIKISGNMNLSDFTSRLNW